MRSHRLPITLSPSVEVRAQRASKPFWSPRDCSVRLAHLMGMDTQDLGLEPLVGVEELAEYLGVPVQTIYDWRLSGRAPRAFKLGKHLRFAASDIAAWLEERHEGGSHE
jgi:excisionase family DNA binding protein